MGYSGDFNLGETAGIHAGCTVRDRAGTTGLFLHDCDGAPGISGGPLLMAEGEGFFVAGIVVSERRGNKKKTDGSKNYSPDVANVGVAAGVFASAVRAVHNRSGESGNGNPVKGSSP